MTTKKRIRGRAPSIQKEPQEQPAHKGKGGTIGGDGVAMPVMPQELPDQPETTVQAEPITQDQINALSPFMALVPSKGIKPGQLPPGVSFFQLDKIPHTTKPYQCTPQDIWNAIETYATTLKPWQDCMDEFHISRAEWYGDATLQIESVPGLYPEIGNVHRLASARKADVYDRAAEGQWIAPIEDLPRGLLQVDRADPNGALTLTAAGGQYLRNKAEFYKRLATERETGTRVQTAKIDQRIQSQSLHVHAHQVAGVGEHDPADLTTMTVEDLISWRRQRLLGETPSKQPAD